MEPVLARGYFQKSTYALRIITGFTLIESARGKKPMENKFSPMDNSLADFTV